MKIWWIGSDRKCLPRVHASISEKPDLTDDRRELHSNSSADKRSQPELKAVNIIKVKVCIHKVIQLARNDCEMPERSMFPA